MSPGLKGLLSGALVVALGLLGMVVYLRLAQEKAPSVAVAPGVPAPQAPSPPPPPASPMDKAVDLFDQVMMADEAQDSAKVKQVLPQALAAYRELGALDADGLYHLSLLQRAGGDYTAALAAAGKVLSDAPNHLLALGAATRIALASGDAAAARGYAARFLAAYEEELASPRPEYGHHDRILPVYRDEARKLAPMGQAKP